MSSHFKNADFMSGIIHAIEKSGDPLAVHFPPQPDDQNELPDKVEHD
jgi:uncharacterized membrane protein